MLGRTRRCVVVGGGVAITTAPLLLLLKTNASRVGIRRFMVSWGVQGLLASFLVFTHG